MVIAPSTKPPRRMSSLPLRSEKNMRVQALIRLRLLVHPPVGLAADREAHLPEPDPHAASKGDLARAGADRLALQEKQDEAGIGPVGQPNAFLIAIYACLQHQR